MSWTVGFTRCAEKEIKKLPVKIQRQLIALVQDIRVSGPVRGDWPNYSKLSDGSHHCHLAYSYVACWRLVDDKIQIVEVYYAGSRKDAPY
jgi:hypothetical protein